MQGNRGEPLICLNNDGGYYLHGRYRMELQPVPLDCQKFTQKLLKIKLYSK